MKALLFLLLFLPVPVMANPCTWQYELTYYVGGRSYKEYVFAGNRQDAITTGNARNPNAKLISTNPVCR